MAVQFVLSNALFLPTSASLLPRSLYRRRRCDADTDETYPRWWALSLPTLGLLGEGGRSTPGTAQLCAPTRETPVRPSKSGLLMSQTAALAARDPKTMIQMMTTVPAGSPVLR